MNYRSVAHLNHQIVDWIAELPRDIDLIVGIPRSGLLVGNLLALHLNLPLTDVEGLLEGRLIQTGKRFRHLEPGAFFAEKRKVLVVDDSVFSGREIQRVKKKISEVGLPHTILYAAVYVDSGAQSQVDLHAEVLPNPRVFEWNLMHHKHVLENSCMDIDGVLCRDPASRENDDGPRYEKFLSGADPFYLPTRPVGWLVTCRLEKYRALTEAWLAARGVRYRELVMMDFPDMAARRAANSYASYKAEVYTRTGAIMFIESSLKQARQIADLSEKPVFCMETRDMVYPGTEATRPRPRHILHEDLGSTTRPLLRDVLKLPRAVGRKLKLALK